MNKNNYIEPVFEDNVSSCLTNQDLLSAGVTNISLNLRNLLIRPGKDFLKTIPSFRNFFAWQNAVILNCASLEPNTQNTFNLVSEVDGSKFKFSVDEILELIDTFDVDMVIYPQSYFNGKAKPKKELKLFIQKNTDKDADVLNFIQQNADLSMYIVGYFSLNLLVKFRQYSSLFIENYKPARDGYNGVFYRDMQDNSILESRRELDFSLLDNNCNCYTCSSGYTCAYLHHLLQNTPLLAQRLLILHNVFYINHLP